MHAATPKKGGKFILGIGHGSTTDSLDSTTHENGFSQNIVYTYANHLFEIDSYDQLHPKLVHSYDSADSASKWVFNIRKDVTFNDDKALTADDVIASINHHRGED